MTDNKPTKPEIKKPAVPQFNKPPVFQKPKMGGFKNQRFPMPTLSRGVR